MKNTILKQVNDVGAKLGYPFYIYSDGTCGKSIVSGKMNAAIMVKKKFPVKELKSEFLNCSAENEEDVLAHLSQIGDNIGFPFYVYANGTCGSTPVSVTNKFPFTMVVKQKFEVEKLVLDPELFQTIHAKRADKKSYHDGSNQSSSTTSFEPIIELSPSELVSQMGTWSDDILKAYFEKYELCKEAQLIMLETRSDDIIKAYIDKYELCYDAELLMIEKCSNDVIKAYISQYQLYLAAEMLIIHVCNEDIIKMYVGRYDFSNTAECLMVEKCGDDIVKVYIEKRSLGGDAQCLMVEKCSDDIIKAYFHKYLIHSDAEQLMVEKCSDDVIKAYFEKHTLCKKVQKLMIEKRSDDVIKAYLKKYSLDDEAQCLMIETCSDEVIKAYVKNKRWLCNEAKNLIDKKYSNYVVKLCR